MSIETAEDLLARGNSLFVDENYEAALAAYTAAIELDSTNADLYVKRASCHKQLKNYAAAIIDCNKAIQLNPKHYQAYYFKGVAAFAEEEYETAKAAFEKGLEFAPNPAQFKTWIRKCQAELEAEEEESVATSPKPAENTQTNTPAPTISAQNQPVVQTPAQNQPVVQTQAQSLPTQSTSTPKFRHEWFQTETHVIVTVYIKNVKKEDATIEFKEKNLSVAVKLPGQNNEFVLDIDLADAIVVSESSYQILSTKIEIKLKKSRPSRWKTLEDQGNDSIGSWTSSSSSDPSSAKLYPSSRGNKDWDKIVPEVEEEKLDGDAALNKVFRDIYAGATDDQRRAMIKSFYESGGTVLSTNWEEVSKGPVKGSPPEGLEMKRWNDN